MATFCPSCSKEITPEITQCPWCAYQFEPQTIDPMSDIENMTQEDGQKRREHIRIAQSFKVSYANPQAFINSYLFDISTGGIFIRTDSPLNRGETISLKIFLPDGEKEMEVLGEVVWSNKDKQVTPEKTFPPGMGVKFLKLSTENRIRLSLNILKYYD